MFIEITWKNSKGKELKTLVEHNKIQGFINGFVEREVKADLKMPEEFTITNQLEPLNTPELLHVEKIALPEEKNLVN
jgi:hypothetical protein